MSLEFKLVCSNPELFSQEESKPKSNKRGSFEPGMHDVVVSAVTYMKPLAKDESWHLFKVEYQGVDGRLITDLLSIPTQDILYNGGTGLYSRLKRFCSALGVELSSDNFNTVLPKMFKNVSNLVGLPLRIKVGYDGFYAQYESQGNFSIKDKDGNTVADGNTFPDRVSISIYCEENGLVPFKAFPNVKGFEKGDVTGDLDFLKPKLKKKVDPFE
jgi:hypothetical protein